MGAVSLGACFPAYEVATGGDGGADATMPADGSTPDATHADSSAETGVESGIAEASGPDAVAIDSASLDASSGDATEVADTGMVDVLVGPPPDAMTVVQAGTYGFTIDPNGTGMYLDASVELSHAFAIDEYEVTVGRFRAWVDAGMPLPSDDASVDPSGPYAAAMVWSDTWNPYATDGAFQGQGSNGCHAEPEALAPTYLSTSPQAAAYPVTCVNWYQAVAFCAFESKRLPTEAEWRVVAQDDGAKSTYPWGDTPDPDCNHAIQDPTTGCGFPVPVGSAPAGRTPNGVYDLAGSVSELLWDRVPSGQSYSYPTGNPVDWYGLAKTVQPTDSFVAIESYFHYLLNYGAEGLQGPWNGSMMPAAAVMGFRCAKTM